MINRRNVLGSKQAFSREEKVALVLLIAAGIGGIFFGTKYLGKNLNAPFNFEYSGPEYISQTEAEQQKMKEMQNRDTDQDGINDYDEQYVYKTSPYLADTDSDGYNDYTELTSGNDPNCPLGKDCFNGDFSADETVDSSDSIVGGLGEQPTFDYESAQAALDGSESSNSTLPSDLENISADELRGLLEQNGIDPTVLDQISDEDLLNLYQQTLTEYQAGQ